MNQRVYSNNKNIKVKKELIYNLEKVTKSNKLAQGFSSVKQIRNKIRSRAFRSRSFVVMVIRRIGEDFMNWLKIPNL